MYTGRMLRTSKINRSTWKQNAFFLLFCFALMLLYALPRRFLLVCASFYFILYDCIPVVAYVLRNRAHHKIHLYFISKINIRCVYETERRNYRKASFFFGLTSSKEKWKKMNLETRILLHDMNNL